MGSEPIDISLQKARIQDRINMVLLKDYCTSAKVREENLLVGLLDIQSESAVQDTFCPIGHAEHSKL